MTRYQSGLGTVMDLTPRALTVEEMQGMLSRLNREGYQCLEAGLRDLVHREWWRGRAAGLLDAMMILDGTWPGLDHGGFRGRPSSGTTLPESTDGRDHI